MVSARRDCERRREAAQQLPCSLADPDPVLIALPAGAYDEHVLVLAVNDALERARD